MSELRMQLRCAIRASLGDFEGVLTATAAFISGAVTPAGDLPSGSGWPNRDMYGLQHTEPSRVVFRVDTGDH